MRTTSSALGIVFSFAALGLAVAGCTHRGPTVVQREGQPDVVGVAQSDTRMNDAIQKARQTSPQFLAALQHPKSDQSKFTFKLRVTDGKKTEHMWTSDVRYDGQLLHGKLVDDAYEVPGYTRGKPVSVAPEQISDWGFTERGEPQGFFTERVIEEMTRTTPTGAR